MTAFNLTQTSQKTQTIRTLIDNQRALDTNTQNTHTQACAGHPDGTREFTMRGSAKVCGVCVRQKNGVFVWNRVDDITLSTRT